MGRLRIRATRSQIVTAERGGTIMKSVRGVSRLAILSILLGGCVACVVASSRPLGVAGHWRIVSYSISPDGQLFTEGVQCVRCQRAVSKIVVRDVWRPNAEVRTVRSSGGLSAAKWLNNNVIAYVRQGRKSEIEELNVRTGRSATIFQSRHAVLLAAWESNRRLLAYTFSVGWRWGTRVSVRMRDVYSALHYLEPEWARQSITHVGVIRLPKRIGASGTKVSVKMDSFVIPPQLIWRNGELLAVVPSDKSYRSRLFNLLTGARVDRAMPLFSVEAVAVSGSGKIAVASTRVWRDRSVPMAGWNGTKRVYVLGSGVGAREIRAASRGDYLIGVTGLRWIGRQDLLVQMIGSRGLGGADRWWLKEVNTRTDRVIGSFRWPNGDLGGVGTPCKFDSRGNVGLCVAQTMNRPPELVRIELNERSMTPIAKMNPREQPLSLKFTKIQIRNRFGDVSTGFLVLPSAAKTHPVPLAVMAYGFTEAYSKDAQWITSYPVSKLVGAGIAVCMVTWAHIPGFKSSRSSGELLAMRSDVSTLESVPGAVRRRGVKISRAMIMGWSFGGLFAAHVIEDDPEYVAAQIGDPADWTVAGYALGNEYWRNISRWGLGGPPIGNAIRNYVAMDPVGSGRRPLGPVLLEFVSQNPAVGQLFEEWRAVGANVEAFVYRRSVHWLNVPAEARISRLRNLYWAELNLLGPKSVTDRQLRSVDLKVPRAGWWNSMNFRDRLSGP